jgi:hypothetical protein
MSDEHPSDSDAPASVGAPLGDDAASPQARSESTKPNTFVSQPETMTAPLDGSTASQKPAKDKKKKATKLKLEIAHQTHGRVRMKVPSAKGNPELLRQIGEAFGVIPGVERVTVNEVTGSVILHYDTDHHASFHDGLSQRFLSENQPYRPPVTEIDSLAQKIECEAEFLAAHSESAKAIVDFFRHIDREIKIASGNVIDFKILLAAGIIGVTVFEVGASAATPIWLTLTIFSLNHIIEMQQPRGQHTPAPAPVVFKTA